MRFFVFTFSHFYIACVCTSIHHVVYILPVICKNFNTNGLRIHHQMLMLFLFQPLHLGLFSYRDVCGEDGTSVVMETTLVPIPQHLILLHLFHSCRSCDEQTVILLFSWAILLFNSKQFHVFVLKYSLNSDFLSQ